jgi:DNA-directed RNA polymerase specialized sigma24 family protein
LPPGGEAPFSTFAEAVFTTASASFGNFDHEQNRDAGSPIVRRLHRQVTRMSISIMTGPPRVKEIQPRRSLEQPDIPSGVMQAVLMHALQLRPSCREVFLLCDIQRHSVSEAAVILGISRTTAKRRLLLARRRMDEVIERLLEAKHQS